MLRANEVAMKAENEVLSSDAPVPLTVTVAKACELTGFGATSIWGFLKDGRLKAVRVPGVRRTLVSYASLTSLLSPPPDPPEPRRRGRPPKLLTRAVVP
jgi:hypothetical protein